MIGLNVNLIPDTLQGSILDWRCNVGRMPRAFNSSGVLNISIAHNSHPYLTKSANAKFRAIHDWAHIELGADDSFNGEWATWENNNAPDSIQWIYSLK
jgi:hypothetical protein